MPIQKAPAAPAAPVAADVVFNMSLDPDTFTESGYLDDVDVVCQDAAWVIWDYDKFKVDAQGNRNNYTTDNWYPFLQLVMRGPDGKDHDQFFKCGSLEHFMPSPDGEFLRGVADPATGQPKKKGIPSGSNAGIFMASLSVAGYPKTVLQSEPISKVFKGLSIHIHQEVQKRTGKPMAGQDPAKESKCMVVDRINTPYPWDAKATGPAPGGVRRAGQAPAAPTPVAVQQQAPVPSAPLPPAPAANGTAQQVLENDTTEILLGAAANGPLAKKDIPAYIFKNGPADATIKGAMIALAYNDGFLGRLPAPLKFDGAVITIG